MIVLINVEALHNWNDLIPQLLVDLVNSRPVNRINILALTNTSAPKSRYRLSIVTTEMKLQTVLKIIFYCNIENLQSLSLYSLYFSSIWVFSRTLIFLNLKDLFFYLRLLYFHFCTYFFTTTQYRIFVFTGARLILGNRNFINLSRFLFPFLVSYFPSIPAAAPT